MTTANSASFLSRVAFEEEVTPGTAGTTPDLYAYTSDDPGINPVQTTIQNVNVQNRDVTCITPSSYHIEGSIPLFATGENMGWFLKWLIGNVSSAQEGATTAYKHSYTPADTLKTFTTWVKRGENQQIKIPYCVVDSMELTQSIDDSLRAVFGIIGKSDSITADYGTENFDTLCPFGNQHLTVSIGGSTSAQAAEVHNTTMNISNGFNVDSGRVHGSRFFSDLIPGKRSVSGSFDMYFNDDSEMQMFWGNSTATGPADELTSQPIVLMWDLGIAAGVGFNYILQVTVPGANYVSTTVNIGGDRVVQSVSFVGKYDTVAANAVSIELTNKTTDYVV